MADRQCLEAAVSGQAASGVGGESLEESLWREPSGSASGPGQNWGSMRGALCHTGAWPRPPVQPWIPDLCPGSGPQEPPWEGYPMGPPWGCRLSPLTAQGGQLGRGWQSHPVRCTDTV